MKKYFILMMMVLSFLSYGCSGYPQKENENRENQNQEEVTKPEKNEDSQESYTIADFFPKKENTFWSYEGSGNEYAGFDRYIEFIENNKIQVSDNNGGTVSAKVIELKEDAIITVFQQEEVYKRQEFLNKSNKKDILLKAPIKVGTTWEDGEGNKRKIESIDTQVQTPVGTYKTVMVVTEQQDALLEHYYAKGVGLVKTVYRFPKDNIEITSTLKEFSQKLIEKPIYLYYPNADGKIEKIERPYVFNTNETVLNALVEELKKETKNENLGIVLSKDVKINSFVMEEKKKVIQMDISQNFLLELNLGAGYEILTLQSFVNTILENYGMDKLILTINGQPLQTGHILMEEGEVLEKNEENVLKK